MRRAGEADQAYFFLLVADIGRFLDRKFDPERKIDPPAPPPGGPIGASGGE